MRELSAGEALIMREIWDAGKDIAVPELMRIMKEKHGKDHRRTTMETFLLRLSDKRFVSTYRNGRYAYVHALIPREEFDRETAKKTTDFWFKGKLSGFVGSYCESRELSVEEIEEIEEILQKARR